MAFSKGLDEEQWRILARMGIAGGGEAAVVKYWVTEAHLRTDEEHEDASANMFVALAERAPQTFDAYTKGESDARFALKHNHPYAPVQHPHTAVETKEIIVR